MLPGRDPGAALRSDAAPRLAHRGLGEWAGAIVSGATAANDLGLQHFWTRWLANPGKPLFSRPTTRWASMRCSTRRASPPGRCCPPCSRARTAGPNNLAAYALATKPAPQEVLDEWASSYERDPALGLDWDLKGPGIIPASSYGAPKIQSVTLANGGHVAVTTPAYTALDDEPDSAADIVLVNITGTSRLHDSASVERGHLGQRQLLYQAGRMCLPTGEPQPGTAAAAIDRAAASGRHRGAAWRCRHCVWAVAVAVLRQEVAADHAGLLPAAHVPGRSQPDHEPARSCYRDPSPLAPRRWRPVDH